MNFRIADTLTESLSKLSGKAKRSISEHIKHIFEDGELTPAATVRLFRTVQPEGRNVTRKVEHYNLNMVLALGFSFIQSFRRSFTRGGNQQCGQIMRPNRIF